MNNTQATALGIDIGGSGIKGAIVDLENGVLLSERHRIPTPQPATPEAVATVFKQLVDHFNWKGNIGVGFPAIIQDGVAKTATNVDDGWIDTDAAKLFTETCGQKVVVLNDADAAGLAEYQFGLGGNKKGVTLLLTIGTGIGSALFINNHLVPNTEFGHVFFKKKIAELSVSDRARKEQELSYEKWGKRFNKYLLHMERILSPNLIVLGGGCSKKFHLYSDSFTTNATVQPAKLLNEAGIIGAAYYANQL